jgi:GDP-4-dehydro-6-deoxy-D-mannose reductase
MKQERLLVFGTGFIASNFINHAIALNKSNLQIKVVFSEHNLSIDGYPVEQIPLKESDSTSFIESFRPTQVLCLHGSSFVPSCLKVRNAIEDNALKTMGLLENIFNSDAKQSIKKILVIGSASEYGKYYQEAISENYPLHATSLYGLSKICLYNASMYYFERGLPIVHVRQFNTIGPAQRECFVLPSFCKQIAEIEKGVRNPVIKVGDLTQERDFIDVRDTCSAYSLLFEKGETGQVYNVSSGKHVTIRHLLDLILEISGVKGKVEVISNQDLISQENSLSHRLHADINNIKNLGFRAEYSLHDTVTDTLNYWRKHV